MPRKKKALTFKQVAPLAVSGLRLVYDIAKPATCPTCGSRVYVFICPKCPKVVTHPIRRA